MQRRLRLNEVEGSAPGGQGALPRRHLQRHLPGRDDRSLIRFAMETRRAELVHWANLVAEADLLHLVSTRPRSSDGVVRDRPLTCRSSSSSAATAPRSSGSSTPAVPEPSSARRDITELSGPPCRSRGKAAAITTFTTRRSQRRSRRNATSTPTITATMSSTDNEEYTEHPCEGPRHRCLRGRDLEDGSTPVRRRGPRRRCARSGRRTG